MKYAAWDVNAGMLLSNAVMYFIILATAATLFEAHKDVNSATDAAQALEPIVGSAANPTRHRPHRRRSARGPGAHGFVGINPIDALFARR